MWFARTLLVSQQVQCFPYTDWCRVDIVILVVG